ncbi:MAG: hypothetical protein ACFCVH_13895 [Alphaproteobacteria bacterium]
MHRYPDSFVNLLVLSMAEMPWDQFASLIDRALLQHPGPDTVAADEDAVSMILQSTQMMVLKREIPPPIEREGNVYQFPRA